MSHSLMAVIMFLMLAGFGTGALLCAYLARAEELSRLAYVAFSVSMMAAANGLGNLSTNHRIALRFALRGVYGRGAIKAFRRLSGGDGNDTAHNLFGHGKKQAE